ncbi:MAG TPA: cell surface protein, partial [Candidatus Coprenecus stercoravium]|nr:cell surface protein [Candidatus Coprenecus stercoravium]
GEDRAEIRIDVYGQNPPVISLPGAIGGFSVLQDSILVLAPEVSSVLPVTYSWTVDGKEVSTDSVYTFPTEETGMFDAGLRVVNRDGADEIEFTVEVLSPGEAFSWTFDRTEYGICAGRSLMLRPLDIKYPFDAVYIWSVDGNEVQSGQTPEYVFDLTAEGSHTVNVTMRNSYTTASQDLTVAVLPAEGTYFRPADGSSNAFISRVFEYTPAPGQFINEGYTAATPAEACDYAFQRLSESQFVSLGAFGGYIVVGFDHSVESGGEGALDLQITGNAHSSSSEPGIIWVSQDENGNGLPDDTWYELRGSEYGKPETWHDYAVTYYRPSGPGMSVEWTDNRGNSGTVDYLKAFHRQDSYYPAWITADSYTLRGTRLQDRLVDESGNGSLWVGHPFDWGYADNWSATDPDIDKFSISDAVRWDGEPAGLKYIDFVKIQCGVQAKGGSTGEQSTELTLIRDLHL